LNGLSEKLLRIIAARALFGLFDFEFLLAIKCRIYFDKK
jgi:hypothetical protein